MTFDPQGLKDWCMCPHCKVNVALDKKNHSIVPPDRLICKVSKLVYKVQTKEFKVTNDQIMNNMLVLSEAVAKLTEELDTNTQNVARVQNNLLNIHNRLTTLENAERRRLEYIRLLSQDIITIVDHLNNSTYGQLQYKTQIDLKELDAIAIETEEKKEEGKTTEKV